MSCLALQIDNGPVFLPLFKMFDSEGNGFVTPKTAGKQQRKKRAISLALELFAVRGLPEREALLNSQPVAQADAQIPDPFDTANPSCEIGAKQTGVLTVALLFAQFFGASSDSLEHFFHLTLLAGRDILKCTFHENGVLAEDRKEDPAPLLR